MFQKTYEKLISFGLTKDTIKQIESGEVQWDIYDNDIIISDSSGMGSYVKKLSECQVKELFNVYEYELRKKYENKTYDCFQPGDVEDWSGVTPDSDWAKYVKGYKDVAILLGEQHSSGFAEPYLFIGRHTIELMLKAIIMLGQEYYSLNFNLPITHDLSQLWTAAFPMMIIYEKMKPELIKNAMKFVIEIQTIDPDATMFKYPVNKRNEQIVKKRKLANFERSSNIDKFKGTFDTLSEIVDAIKFKIILKEMDKEYRKVKG